MLAKISKFTVIQYFTYFLWYIQAGLLLLVFSRTYSVSIESLALAWQLFSHQRI